jgi:hypothetical protein
VLALFPDLRRDAQRPDFTIYMVFFDLLPRVREAHLEDDTEMLRRIYVFAEWCFEQRAKDIWNAAGVAFYEHLFDSHPRLWPEFVRWLSPRVVEGCWGLWERRLSAGELAEVQALVTECRRPLYQEARLTTPRF